MKKQNLISKLPTKEQADNYDLLYPMLESALQEVREFSKKKQDGVLNPLKVKLLNRLLTEIKNDVLTFDSSNDYLDLLDDETLPQNSDAVLILGQYEAAMKQFKAKYYGYNSGRGEWIWNTGSSVKR
ncbi:hypothetical protein [Fictibacillus barbaricus]|uniref:Uncharacterized protein n=1 Tax=Fictibacillus barbaricus TaxID=182136 RepID=A0ABU1TV02_9BACL|nr:hypothetical protein [Fictibacillus barbaricus]MDR7071035.1 hypothetical protein [Fictibacillus barbaricus]